MKQTLKARLDLSTLEQGILNGDRIILGQAITLIESNLPQDQQLADQLLEKILPHTGKALRIGITGVPGVGKSTFIETFGKHIIDQQKKLAVLTIDPSSPITKGSILGDKTRMESLSKDERAFIRPTASSQSLGGVAFKTRESILLCEAAGFDVIIVETVGVGQSEGAVKSMVDFFLLLMLAGAGDELQGIKKGIMEFADAIIITKADGDNVKPAVAAQAVYQQALHLQSPSSSGWHPVVLTASAYTGDNIAESWQMIQKYQHDTMISGFFTSNRAHQQIEWFQEYFTYLLNTDLHHHKSLRDLQALLTKNVATGELSAQAAARKLMEAYHKAVRG